MWAIIIWIALILASWYYIYRSRSNYPFYFLIVTYLIKIVSGLLIGLYYFKIKEGQGDTFLYFHKSVKILEGGITDVLRFFFKNELNNDLDTPRTGFFIKILIPIVWVSVKNYWLSVILLANISYLSLLVLLNRYKVYFAENVRVILICFFAFPSVLLWTSGIFKETLALTFIFISILPILEYTFQKNKIPNYWLFSLAILGVLALTELRYFLTFCLLSIYVVLIYRSLKWNYKHYLLPVLVALPIIFLFWHPVLNPQHFPTYLIDAHKGLLKTDPGFIQNFYNEDLSGWKFIIYNLPMAFVNSFIRPFPWEWQNIGLSLYAIEGYLIIIFFLFQVKKIASFKWSDMLVFAIIFISIMTIALATPNFGTLYRYRSVLIPFLLLYFFIISNIRNKSLDKPSL